MKVRQELYGHYLLSSHTKYNQSHLASHVAGLRHHWLNTLPHQRWGEFFILQTDTRLHAAIRSRARQNDFDCTCGMATEQILAIHLPGYVENFHGCSAKINLNLLTFLTFAKIL
jgi:hypothetical protein